MECYGGFWISVFKTRGMINGVSEGGNGYGGGDCDGDGDGDGGEQGEE